MTGDVTGRRGSNALDPQVTHSKGVCFCCTSARTENIVKFLCSEPPFKVSGGSTRVFLPTQHTREYEPSLRVPGVEGLRWCAISEGEQGNGDRLERGRWRISGG